MPEPGLAEPELAEPGRGRPTLVLLHGIGGNAAGFAPLVARFRALGWPAIAWSQPGYDGMPLIEPYALGGCARALRGWLAERRAGRVVLVGHSMGGMLAQTYRLAIEAIAAFDGRAHLAGIRVPVLCLAAEHDQTSTPAVLQRMAQRIPGADYLCLEGLGHLAPIEDPQRWAATVATWCGRRIANDPWELP